MNVPHTAAPRVSVCIPTYRGAETLAAAIESVLAQTHADFELIVVDDASPDDTAAVVARFTDPRLRYVRNMRNLGPEGNWNHCLALARGTYFKLLPHDDLLRRDCLERQVAVLDADTGGHIAFAFSARDVIGRGGEVLLAGRGVPGAPSGRIGGDELLRRCLRHGTNVIGEPGAVLFRRTLGAIVGGFDARYPYVVDFDYWTRLLEHGDAWYDAEALASFRVWRGSWSVAIGAGQRADFNRFMAGLDARARLAAATPWDRLCGCVTPALNNLARLGFYRLFVHRDRRSA